MLKIKALRQTPSHCGPFCLKMVFDYYGFKVNEEIIAKIAGTTIKDGTPPMQMIRTAKHFGFDAEYIKNFNIKKLRDLVLKDKVPVIVSWFSTDKDHYSVVVDIKGDKIYLQDPEKGKIHYLDMETFLRVWFDLGEEPVRLGDKIRIRPVIIVRPKKEH